MNEATETKRKYLEGWDKLKAFNDCSLETIKTLLELEGEKEEEDTDEETSKVEKWFKTSQDKLKTHWNIEVLKKRYETAVCKIQFLKPMIEGVSQLTEKPMCPICWKNSVTTFNMSCGHTQCTYCSESVTKTNMCPICRQSVTEVKKLYF